MFRQTCVGCLRQQGLQARRISGQQRQERQKVGGGGTEDEEGSSERQFLWFGSSCGSMYSQHFCLQTETFLFALQARFLNLWPSDLQCIWHWSGVRLQLPAHRGRAFSLDPAARRDGAPHKKTDNLCDNSAARRKTQKYSLQMKVYLSLGSVVLSNSNKARLQEWEARHELHICWESDPGSTCSKVHSAISVGLC